MAARAPKRPRAAQGGPSKESTMIKLLGAHDAALERMKAALVIFVFVPKPLHDAIEAAAKSWKDKAKPGEAHPDNCSCTTARLKAFLNAISEAMSATPPLLDAATEAKGFLTSLVEAVRQGKAEELVSDITLRVAGSRSPDQSPYEITLVSSAEGQMLRSALFAIAQPSAGSAVNTREMAVKVWEVRAYRPHRRGALMKELTAGN